MQRDGNVKGLRIFFAAFGKNQPFLAVCTIIAAHLWGLFWILWYDFLSHPRHAFPFSQKGEGVAKRRMRIGFRFGYAFGIRVTPHPPQAVPLPLSAESGRQFSCPYPFLSLVGECPFTISQCFRKGAYQSLPLFAKRGRCREATDEDFPPAFSTLHIYAHARA